MGFIILDPPRFRGYISRYMGVRLLACFSGEKRLPPPADLWLRRTSEPAVPPAQELRVTRHELD